MIWKANFIFTKTIFQCCLSLKLLKFRKWTRMEYLMQTFFQWVEELGQHPPILGKIFFEDLARWGIEELDVIHWFEIIVSQLGFRLNFCLAHHYFQRYMKRGPLANLWYESLEVRLAFGCSVHDVLEEKIVNVSSFRYYSCLSTNQEFVNSLIIPNNHTCD